MLVLLRALVPYRRLSYQESLFYAEQQSAIFLKLVHVLEPPVPVERLVTEVGLAAEVQDDQAQATPGLARFDRARGDWIISLNVEHGPAEREFVIAHEVKHIADDGFGATLYRPIDVMTVHEREEHAADFFAMSLLAPRPWVERQWRRGDRNIERLAREFGVSPARMRLRLEALGLLADDDANMRS
jgi:Zn-dependent peptidase ImmA (M78 family)